MLSLWYIPLPTAVMQKAGVGQKQKRSRRRKVCKETFCCFNSGLSIDAAAGYPPRRERKNIYEYSQSLPNSSFEIWGSNFEKRRSPPLCDKSRQTHIKGKTDGIMTDVQRAAPFFAPCAAESPKNTNPAAKARASTGGRIADK